jgi:hypothetical protein
MEDPALRAAVILFRSLVMPYDPADYALASSDPIASPIHRPPAQADEVVEEHIARLDKAATLRALEELVSLPLNGSGYGDCPIGPERIQSAKAFLSALSCEIIATPKVVPMTRGRLQFEWHRGNRSLELEFETSDRIHYLKWDSDVDIEEEDAIPLNDCAKIQALLRWFARDSANVSMALRDCGRARGRPSP